MGGQRRPDRSLEGGKSGEGPINEKEEKVLDMQLRKGIDHVLEQIIGYLGEVVKPGFVSQVLELSPGVLCIYVSTGEKYKVC